MKLPGWTIPLVFAFLASGLSQAQTSEPSSTHAHGIDRVRLMSSVFGECMPVPATVAFEAGGYGETFGCKGKDGSREIRLVLGVYRTPEEAHMAFLERRINGAWAIEGSYGDESYLSSYVNIRVDSVIARFRYSGLQEQVFAPHARALASRLREGTARSSESPAAISIDIDDIEHVPGGLEVGFRVRATHGYVVENGAPTEIEHRYRYAVRQNLAAYPVTLRAALEFGQVAKTTTRED